MHGISFWVLQIQIDTPLLYKTSQVDVHMSLLCCTNIHDDDDDDDDDDDEKDLFG